MVYSTPPLSIQSTFHSIRAQSDWFTCVHMKFKYNWAINLIILYIYDQIISVLHHFFQSSWNFLQSELSQINWSVYTKTFQSHWVFSLVACKCNYLRWSFCNVRFDQFSVETLKLYKALWNSLDSTITTSRFDLVQLELENFGVYVFWVFACINGCVIAYSHLLSRGLCFRISCWADRLLCCQTAVCQCVKAGAKQAPLWLCV